MQMGEIFLKLAASACAVAALPHFACIPWGADGYRFLGAGEVVADAVASGDWRPPISAALVGTLLLVLAAYALAGAGVIQPLPLLQPVLFGSAAVLLLRAVMFPLLRPMFPGNSDVFWYVSSGAVGLLGLFILLGALWLKK
jgi:hypothetical protein